MKNIKLLSQILKRTNKLIISDEYKQSYSLGNSFLKNLLRRLCVSANF